MEAQSQFILQHKISEENIQFYHDFGYLIAPDMLDKNEVLQLKNETVKIFRGEYGIIEGMHPVTNEESDSEILKKYLAIHFPNKISPLIKDFLAHPSIVEVLKNVISPNVKCMQSMLFVKGPNKAGQSWHQDECFIPTRDKSLIGAWIAIDDATVENGCLWIIPGSHKAGYLMSRIANTSNEYADTDTIDTAAFSENEKIPVEVKSGSVVFFNGYLLHSSNRNKTINDFRTALVNHYMSAESMLPWNTINEEKYSNDCRDIVMVAGNDPYAYKGIENINKPYLRPEKN